ncbi:anhydro-N-acetylmuramic acid kinase [Candidatus Pelagibacter sp.]|uniref:anhydro-N-acetylmuramic acid kinase n=1 Tax=Candidatus Pelagibacter sp. TaxID=2024849 RepID=UPI003F8397CF
MKQKIFTSIGLMSGTSMDGVDLSVIKSDGYDQFSSIYDTYKEFDDGLYKQLISLRDKISNFTDLKTHSKEINDVEKKFTLFNGHLINEVIGNINEDIDLIGFHGQTVFHDPKIQISKQIGDGKLLSSLFKKIVINNFRQNDLNHGGQGAPLTPIFHCLISKIIQKNFKLKLPINIINIGGITNITQIKEDINNSIKFFAYDVGPGNCLIDDWVRNNKDLKFDKDGNYANIGKVDDLIFNQAIDNFEFKSYETSLDVKDFDISFVKGLSFEDGCATLTKFTAYLIADGLRKINKLNDTIPHQYIFCGGGRKNKSLIQSIENYLSNKNIIIKDIDDYNFDGNFIESQAFAYLAIRSLLKLPISFPSTTRCKKAVSGGEVFRNF